MGIFQSAIPSGQHGLPKRRLTEPKKPLKRRIRVALIDPLGQYAGNHYYTDQLARGLSSAGAEVSVFTHNGNVDHTTVRPYEYHETFRGIYGGRHVAIRGLQFARCLVATYAMIARKNVDLVHIQMWTHDIREILQILLAKLLRKGLVVSVHEVKGWSSRKSTIGRSDAQSREQNFKATRTFRWVLKHADAAIVHNRYSLDLLTSIYDPAIPVSIVPLPHVANDGLRLPDRSEARTRLGLPQDKTVLLFFGNCRLEKRLDLAFNALAEVEGSDLLLVTAGKMKSHEEEYFKDLAHKLQLGQKLRMDIGLISDDAAVDYFRAANAVVIPYREIAESGVAITASTYGRAIIASDLAPLLEATQNGQLGLHFRNGSSDELARAMQRATLMTSELDAMGAAARAKVIQERDPDAIGGMVLQLYLELLAR